jgi:hypothetical protein
MKPEELEDLLMRHPELAPSPELEVRILVGRRRRRMPALIPAAAAILFVVGVVVSVVSTLSTPAGKGKKDPDGPYLIRFLKEDQKWKVSPPNFYDVLPELKERGVAFSGPPETPWGLVRHVRRACVNAEIADCEWRIADRSLKVAAYVPVTQGEPDRVILETIHVRLSWDPVRGGLDRRVGERGPVGTEQDLMPILLTMKADYKKAGKKTFPVLIDAAADVAWYEVARVIEICRKEGFSEFFDPVPAPKVDPPLWKPERRLFPDRPEDK